ncbi:MAG TPA: hypothetical protein VHO28_07465 [Ignavibacteriales bacterium]|nr:hypothetical protein [Ignavibacteriales bacterium]
MKKGNILLLFISYLFLIGKCEAQISESALLPVYKIYNADVNNILDHSIRAPEDSIRVLSRQDSYYFLYKISGIKTEPFAKLFSYNEKKGGLDVIIDSLFYFSNSPASQLNMLNENIIHHESYDSDLEKGKIGGLRLLIIDVTVNKIKKNIKLPKGTFGERVYVRNDSLYVIVQPVKAQRNIYYYLTFWFPRGRSPKWNYIEAGNKILYTLDKDFNIIKQEEIVENKEE